MTLAVNICVYGCDALIISYSSALVMKVAGRWVHVY